MEISKKQLFLKILKHFKHLNSGHNVRARLLPITYISRRIILNLNQRNCTIAYRNVLQVKCTASSNCAAYKKATRKNKYSTQSTCIYNSFRNAAINLSFRFVTRLSNFYEALCRVRHGGIKWNKNAARKVRGVKYARLIDR